MGESKVTICDTAVSPSYWLKQACQQLDDGFGALLVTLVYAAAVAISHYCPLPSGGSTSGGTIMSRAQLGILCLADFVANPVLR